MPLWVGLVLVSVVALVAGFGWSSSRASQCSARSVAQRTMASVVTIFVRSATGAQSNGSGEFIDGAGHILTNNHVINSSLGGGTITVLRPNGEELPARLVGRDNATDLAVIEVQPRSGVVPVAFGPAPEVGDQVFAIGAPMGLSDTLTAGVVGALGRSVRVPADPGTTALITSAVQTDASINPGNSGGTLANCAGQLVGVPTAGATANDSTGQPVGGSIGLGFAIPADFAQRVAELLIADGRVTHGNAGVSVVPVARGSDATKPDGLYVAEVVPGGAADRAGLRHGDIITELDGRPVTGADQLQAITLTQGPGSKVEVTYDRNGASRTTTMTLQG
jgi:putative serine protease PepD